MRRTSLEAYNKIKADGRLGKRQFQAYDTLFKSGPLTGNELCRIAELPGLWKRCSELEKMQLIYPATERRCSVTNELATAWDVTDRMPEVYEPETLDPIDRQCDVIAAIDDKLSALQTKRDKELLKLRYLTQDHCGKCKSFNVERLALAPVLKCLDCQTSAEIKKENAHE